jgi:antitoxin (DNA-binding transcriptional repressor) of toxin-antitoxin stability system
VSLTVNIGEAKARLSDLIAKVEGGEDVIIARGEQPVARLTRILHDMDVASAIKEIKTARAGRPKTTADEILAWRDEGRRP